jgi:hypothetical protein
VRIVPVTPPAIEPVTLAEAQLHLRMESDSGAADAALISSLITAGREYCEKRSHLAFITQTYDLFLDAWDNRPWSNLTGYVGWSAMSGTTIYNNAWRTNQVNIPVGPVQSVTFVKYTDQGQNLQTWDPSNYLISTGNPGRLAPIQNVVFPAVATQIDAVQIRTVAGFGDEETDVPARAQAAIKLVMTWLYANRSPTAMEERAVDVLLNSLGCGSNLFA